MRKGATKNFEICFYFITLHAVHGASGAPETMQNLVKCLARLRKHDPLHRAGLGLGLRLGLRLGLGVGLELELGLGLILQRPPGVVGGSINAATKQLERG